MTIGLFGFLVGLMPSEFFTNQPDYSAPTNQNRIVITYLSANNLTVYSQTFVADLTYPDGYAYNQSGLPDDHRVEIFWDDDGTILLEYPKLYFRHAFPGVLGNLWLDHGPMEIQEPYYTLMGEPEHDYTLYPNFHSNKGIDRTQLLRLCSDGNSSYFVTSDGVITQNFVVMNPGTYESLAAAWDDGNLTVLSSYEMDFEAMKPNAFSLIAQLVTFQNPDFGIPGMFGEILTTGLSLAFWIVIAIIIYSVITGLIPTIRGGVES